MLKKILDFINDYHDKRVAYIQLNYLTDKQLQDLGLTRAQITETVYGRKKV
jgi:uncharacterized protein YjiS (DUF1127 family)